MSTTRASLEYRNLNQVKKLIELKIKESLNFAGLYVPNYIQSPQECFEWLKTRTSYQLDPPGVELLQSFQSLILDNYHGIPGAGDCDCLTIAGAATLLTRRKNIDVRLIYSGNGNKPTHIYLEANGTPFDLTVNNYGTRRQYKRHDF